MKTILYNETIPVYKEYKFNTVVNIITVNRRVTKWMKFKRLVHREAGWWLKVIGFRDFGQ